MIPFRNNLPYKQCILAVLLVLIESCGAFAQQQVKKQLTRDDYQRWGSLQPLELSATGKWASFAMNYENGNDTVMVKSTHNDKCYRIAGATGGSFGGDTAFACMLRSGKLQVQDLATGAVRFYDGITQYGYSTGGRYLITLGTNSSGDAELKIYDGINLLKTISTVTEIAWNEQRDAIAYSTLRETDNSVAVLSLNGRPAIKTIAQGSLTYQRLQWSDNGHEIVFYSTEAGTAKFSAIWCYRLNHNKLLSFSPEACPDFPKTMELDMGYSMAVTISGDGKRVFFGIKGKEPFASTYKDIVDVWNGNDKWLFPVKKQVNDWKNHPKLALWYPDSGAFKQISSLDHPWVMLTGDHKHAILANPGTYLPQYTLNGIMDYYLFDIQTGTTTVLAAKVSGETMNMAVSGDGRYISFYRENDWYLYDITLKTHRNLTKGLAVKWDFTDLDPANAHAVYGNAGFTKDGKNVMLYDAFDIWVFPISGEKPRRLTSGRESATRYTFNEMSIYRGKSNYSGRAPATLSLSGSLVFDTFNTNTSDEGYFIWNKKTGIKPMVFRNSCADRVMRSSDGKTFMYREQDYEMPPTLIINSGQKEKVIYHSNKCHDNYSWGRKEMIHYNYNGARLNAAVFYPVNYKPGILYPTVVYIYERLSRYIHQYVNPSMQNVTGFNITNLTSQGYVVLLPDITYSKGNPGGSSLGCVSAATTILIDKGISDPEKIGITGHSFGGYQTNYIITHSNLFAAAFSGSGVSDFVSAYFTYGKMIGNADMWRYESQQFRMGEPFYKTPDAYLRNSPIITADKVTAAVLLWSGDADDVINPAQTMEFYLALRRLGKQCIMLSYPGMGHVPTNPLQKSDLTERLENWFAHYLKHNAAAPWIDYGTK